MIDFVNAFGETSVRARMDGRVFDYVVVGAGSAGCVLANRLSEDAANRVCLIEAGPRDRNPLIHIPAGVVGLVDHPVVNWRFRTSPQRHAADRTIKVPTGKVLGGSSSINGMVYIRGHAGDYDDWAAAGNAGWSYREVLPYFRKSENNETWGETEFHGAGGPLNVTHLAHPNPMLDVLLAATDSLQLPRCKDFNGASQEGFGPRQVTIKNGRRHSTARAFLAPARRRANLAVVTDGLVERIAFANGRAVGVELATGDGPRRIDARREVIVSAGTIGSPVLLLRSGIGEAVELRGHGIDVVRNIPAVGRNLHDHANAVIQFASPSATPYGISVRAAPWLAWNALRYLLFRQGIFASNVVEGGGFVKSDPSLARPDIQFGFLPGHRSPKGKVLAYGHGYSLSTILIRPKSRGRVALASADPRVAPAIDMGTFNDAADVDILVRALKLGRRILNAPAFDPYRGAELRPGPAAQSDDELAAYIRHNSDTIHHPVGTCRMGSDADSVVDPQLRVRGIDGLRVVDASVIPTIVGGNTNAPVIMIAEKAADMILGRPPLPPARVATA